MQKHFIMDLQNNYSRSGNSNFLTSNYSELGLEASQESLIVHPQNSTPPIQIPLTSSSACHVDPRFKDKVWRENIYEIKQNDLNSYNIPSLKTKKLNIIIDLESMIYKIHPKVSHNQETIQAEIKRLRNQYHQCFKSIYFSAGSVYYIIAIRHNLDSFLRSLNQKAILHLITKISDNYLHEILKAVDPYWNYFQGRVHHSKSAERSLSELGLESNDTLIIDTNIGHWRMEDQGNVIQSMKYIPCPQEHSEYENSSKYQELVKSYTYFKGLTVVDEKKLFIDKEDQFPCILKIVSKIHKARFLWFYTKGVSELFQILKSQVLKGKSIFFLCGNEEAIDVKIEVYRAIVESLGGTVIGSSCEADYIISDENASTIPGKFKKSEWLISKFFKLI
ncbi:unnamed protein product [Blepharisma stoltei]|uniref:FCP1 homology domain-containing protein n=1 Tax=Blepharisma stoltei TaxID=1481888 RepID=A0AAU9J870_9CILI|nr:unnamed protein product [Blepharisma stoltei]